jgi:hypothetical protein
MVEQRLVVADTSMLARDLGAFAIWLKDLRRQFPDRPIIGFADNFHHYDIRSGGPSEGEGRLQYIARYAKDLAIKYRCTLVMTMELPKESLKPGVRPRISTIKGSASMAYEASANIGVYNDMKDFGTKSVLTWEDKKDQEVVEGPTGEKITRPKIKPIIELVFDKSKIYRGFDGVIYYKLDPATGRYDEEPACQQGHWENVAQAQLQETKTDYDGPGPGGEGQKKKAYPTGEPPVSDDLGQQHSISQTLMKKLTHLPPAAAPRPMR